MSNNFKPSLNKGVIRKDISTNDHQYTGVFNIDDEIFDVTMRVNDEDDTRTIFGYSNDTIEKGVIFINNNTGKYAADFTGRLELNSEIVSSKSPDYTGYMTMVSGNGDIEYALVGWVKTGKRSKFLSLSIDLIEDF